MDIVNNKKHFRYEWTLEDGEVATLEYRWLKGSLVLMHTVVPKSGRGKGTGGALVKYVLDQARAQELKIVVYCPFVQKYIDTHPEYAGLIDEAHRRK